MHNDRIPLTIVYILRLYLIGIVFFTFYRMVLCCNNLKSIHEIPNNLAIMLQSFFMGLRFDVVICGYVLAIPAIILLITELLRIKKKGILLSAYILTAVLYTLCFFICAADIPFFQNYNSRLNITVLNWTDSPVFMLKMVLEERSYLVYLILFIIISTLFILYLRKVYKSHWRATNANKEKNPLFLRIIASILFLGLMFLGIRGRIEAKSPILAGTAYFSNYSFANQAGLNPVFTFMQSWEDAGQAENKKLNLMPDKDALRSCQYYLHIPADSINAQYPIARIVQTEGATQKPNIVIVLMESMSAAYLKRYGNINDLTPNLDSFAAHAYTFDHFYSAGIHTFNGIFSTLYSFPALMAKHTMYGVVMHKYTGLPLLAKRNGYQNIYFTTHDEQFDNVGAFLTSNNFDHIVGKKDYPASEVIGPLGIPDHLLFNHALTVFNSCYEHKQPFFATLMTASNHGPYIIPKGIDFTPKHREIRGGCVEYADWAIGQFMRNAAIQPWFANTVFVFLADHGTWEGDNYSDLALSLNHIPCIIYSPALIDNPKNIEKPGGQIDISPTIAGLLHWSYTNNTMGIDLLHQERRWIYFSQDDKAAVADNDHVYIWHTDKRENLLSFNSKDTLHNTAQTDSMRNFLFAMLQSTQWLTDNNKTGSLTRATKK